MRCSNCGKEIPFAGQVCPFCHADKSYNQKVLGLTYFIIMGGGGIGWWIGGAREMWIGMGIGFFLSLVVMALNVQYRKKHPVEIEPEPHNDSPSDMKARLEQLEGLKNSGLLSSQEYADKRKELLAQL